MFNTILKIYVDGSCRANGKETAISGIGVYGIKNDKEFMSVSKIVLAKTNNEAEYLAVYNSLRILGEYHEADITIYSDSKLVVNQLNRTWRIKEERLLDLYTKTRSASKHFKNLKFVWIGREKNKIANNLAQGITEFKKEK